MEIVIGVIVLSVAIIIFGVWLSLVVNAMFKIWDWMYNRPVRDSKMEATLRYRNEFWQEYVKANRLKPYCQRKE